MYDIGDVAKLKGAFTNRKLTEAELKKFREAGTLPEGTGVDPDTVVCTVVVDGEVSKPPVTKAAAGVYTAKHTITTDAATGYAFDGTGERQASGENRLRIKARAVPRS
jgi:hypothetical protein